MAMSFAEWFCGDVDSARKTVPEDPLPSTAIFRQAMLLGTAHRVNGNNNALMDLFILIC